MARPGPRIEVTSKDKKELKKLLSGGVQQVRVVLRALALLRLAEGVSAPQIAARIPLTAQAIRKIGHRYQEAGLERALYEKERPAAAAVLEDGQKQRIIAKVCSDPPEGCARWTVRLVAEEAVKRRLVPRVGRRPSGFCCVFFFVLNRFASLSRHPFQIGRDSARLQSV
jgi:putative transposase